MALTQVTGPYPIFTDLDGSPLDDGYLYIGEINEDPETNPIQVYWDSNLTIPATQPIRTNSGYAYRNGTPALIYTGSQFSITIRNKKREFVLYSPVGYGFDPGAASASVVKNDFTGDGVEVAFTLSASPSTKLATSVFINGVYQEKDSYSLSGNVITFSVAPPLSSSIEVMTNETGVINTGNATAITYTANFPGAVQETVQTKLEQYVSVKDFGAVGDGVTDDTAAIQAALDYAGSLSISDPTFPGYGYVVKGGTTVFIPAGEYITSATLTVPQNVSVVGDGKYSSIIKSSVDGNILQNDGTPTVTGTYDVAGIAYRNFSIIGDRTKTSQIGFAFLRLTSATLENLAVSKCGSHGILMLQCGVNQINNLESTYNVGEGIAIGAGITVWGGTSNGLPSNANVFTYYRGLQNDGAGIRFYNGTNGNIFIGATCEYNYYSSGNNVGYNVHVATDSNTPNIFYGLWTEGPVEAHVYVACTDSSIVTKLVDWRHFGNGTSGNVNRALIVNGGYVYVNNASATSTSYKTLSGSDSPFRIANKTNSAISVVNSYGANVSGLDLVDDATGAHTGLYGNLKQDCIAVDGTTYGPQTAYNDGGAVNGVGYRNDTDAYSWYQSRAFYRDVVLGDGASTPDAGFKRVGAGQIGPRAGDFFNVGYAWNGSHLIMGFYHLWVDASGRLRIKSSAPTSDTDGTIVGTQS